MKHPTTNISRSGRSRLALQISLAFGATAMMAAGSAMAAGSNNGGSMTNFRQMFINNVVKGTRVHGRVGVYDFRRWHNLNSSEQKLRSTAYGGWLDMHTGMLYGFSAGGEFVYSSNFYDPNNGHQWAGNGNLVNSHGPVANISALYLQYNAPGFQVRAGRQLIKTPFASFDRFSFNPRAFDGVTVEAEPLKWMGINSSPMAGSNNGAGGRAKAPDLSMNAYIGLSPNASNGQTWKLYASKFSRMKSRGMGNSFFKGSNFYDLNDSHGNTSGFWQIGTSYQRNTPNGNYLFQFYHDTFQQIENVEYLEGGYMAPAFGSQNIAPYIRAQYVRSDGANNLTSGLTSQGVHHIKSDIFGIKLGFKSNYVNGAFFANYSPTHNGTLGDGRMLHPYSDLSGYLYSDTMNEGMQEIGPGTAVGASMALKPGYGIGMSAKASYFHAKHGYGHAYYRIGKKGCHFNPSKPSSYSKLGVQSNCGSENSWEADVGVSYNFGYLKKALTGLKIEDKVGITHFNSDTPKKTFYDNRFRFSYNF